MCIWNISLYIYCMGSHESVFLTRVIASSEVMAKEVQGVIVQSEGRDSWVASHLEPQSGTNIGNISLDFHHSCAHRPRKWEIQIQKNRITFVHCKQLPPTHLLRFFSFNIFVFPNTFLPPSFTSSCSSHFFLSILLPVLSSSFQIFFLYFHSYVSHSHILSSPLPIFVFPILLFSTLSSSLLSFFMSFLHFLLFH